VPGLGALDVHRVDVVGVEMGAETLAPPRRQIEVALHLAAERLLHGGGERGQPRAQMVDVVGHQGGAAAQEILDPAGVGAQQRAAGIGSWSSTSCSEFCDQMVAWPSRSFSLAQVITSANLSAAPFRWRGFLPSYSAKKRSAPSGAMIASKLNGGLSMLRF